MISLIASSRTKDLKDIDDSYFIELLMLRLLLVLLVVFLVFFLSLLSWDLWLYDRCWTLTEETKTTTPSCRGDSRCLLSVLICSDTLDILGSNLILSRVT